MSYRISEKNLEDIIERLNNVSKVKYKQNGAYGYSQLAVAIPNSGGCIATMSNGNTKKELYEKIEFTLNWIQNEKNQRYLMRDCRHRDEMNYFEGKRNVSLIREYTNKKTDEKTYKCISCNKEFTQETFIESNKEITWSKIKKEMEVIEN